MGVLGLDQLATTSALVLFGAASHLLAMDPTSPAFDDLRQHYTKAFPGGDDFGSWFHWIMSAVHRVFIQSWESPPWGDDHQPSIDERIIVSRNLADLALHEREWRHWMKIPC